MRLIPIVLVAACVLLAGCEDSPLRNFITGKSSSDSSAAPSATSDSITPTTEPTETENDAPPADSSPKPLLQYGEDISVPAEFPDDVPIYSGAKLTATEIVTEEKTFGLQLTSADPIESVFIFYEQNFPAKGWSVSPELTDTKDDDLRMLGYTKAGQFASVTLIRNSSSTLIHLSTGPLTKD